jgi:hypothetical protein
VEKLAKLMVGAAETEQAEIIVALTVKLPTWVAAPAAPLNATAPAKKPILYLVNISITILQGYL